ncbi:MAG: DUF4091 domain-containing protein [Candidatus Anammoximicrobium sp.]|nr:DUF4091 domain-containing protein [Candidatus Anammoximicrobium sp.]
MVRLCFGIVAVCLFVSSAAVAPAAPWHHPLSLDGMGWWQKRVAVKVTNDGSAELAGFPVSLAAGSAAGQIPLAGQQAQSLRVCDARGIEMLFGLRDAGGATVEQGPIPDGSILVIPVECPPQTAALYYVYFDNRRAGRLPDFLSARVGLTNGDVELGDGDAPAGWRHDEADDQHRASWSEEHPQSGRRCLKTIVAAGAEPTWIATRQGDIAIVGGAKYRVQAWVKAQDVRGSCGWYLHAGNEQQPMLTAPMLPAGDGTFDWKQVVLEFTAPVEADRLSLGTVLRGTGTAWFDNVSLECLVPGAVRTEVLSVETVSIRELGTEASWYKAAGAKEPSLPYRAAIGALNLGDETHERTAVALELGRLQARMRGRLHPASLVLTHEGRLVPHQRLGDQLLFAAQLPPRSSSTFYLYFSAAAPAASAAVREGTPLVDSAVNLVRNPSFEAGEGLPDAWTASGASQSQAVTFGFDDSRRGPGDSRCAKMHVPDEAARSWRGWRQDVPVQPGRTYLLSAWVKCQSVRGGEVRLHAHRRTAAGQLSQQGGYASVGPGLTGSADWTLISGMLSMPEDTTTLQLHLTMDCTGTVWHDGVTLFDVVPGQCVGLESQHAAPDGGLAVWQVPAVVKVFQDDLPCDQARQQSKQAQQPVTAEIFAARNEQESLQLAVRSPRALSGVQIAVDPPVGPQGRVLKDVRIEVVGYVPIDHPSSYYQTKAPAWHRKVPANAGRGDGWAGLWPDPLLPRQTVDLQANLTQPIWVTVSVPKEAPAGDYQGRVRLLSSGQTLASVPVRIHVWDFTLPDENHVAAIYDVRFGPDRGIWGQPLDAMYPEIIRFLASRRLCPDTIRPAPVFRRENGKITADFTDFDRAAKVYFDELKFPFAYTPWNLYLFGWGHPPKTVFGERPYEGEPPFAAADRRRLRPEYKRIYQELLRLYWEHLQEKGWHRRIVLYISDEPFDHHEHIRQQMKALCDMIHEVDPEIPIYCSTWKHVPDWDRYLDIWGIGHYGCVPSEKMAELRAAGDRVWFTTDGQMCTDTPYCAVERLLPHYCFKYGAEAYEFWGVSWHTYDPYRFGWHSFINQSSEPGESYWVRYPNGDGFLLYPGQPIGHAGPVSSIRLEQAREGVEDYEHLFLLKSRMEAGRRAGKPTDAAERALNDAQELVQIPNDGGYYSTRILPDPERLYSVRRAVAAAIELLGP